MEDKLQILHANLIKEGYDLPDYNTFKLDMADPIKSKKLHDNLTTEGYDLPDYGTFLKDMDVKKKVSSQDAFTSASGKEEIPFLGQSGKNLVNPQSSSTQPLQSTSDNLRVDGTKKANGFLGKLTRPDGDVSTELSIGVNLNGKDTEIPTLVPTLSEEEKKYLLSTDPDKIFTANPNLYKGIEQKAVKHAEERIAQGKSPFAENSESPSEQPRRTTSPIGDILRSLKSGSITALGGIAGVPNFLTKTVASFTTRPLIKAFGGTDQDAENAINASMALNPLGQVTLGGEKAQQKLNALAAKTDAKIFPIEGNIVKNIQEGDFGQAGELLVRGIFQSAPYLAMTMATAGGGTAAVLSTIGATSASQQYGSLKGKPETKRLLNSWLYGGFEAAGELVTAGIARGIGTAFKQAATQEAKDNLIKGAVKEITKDFGLESSSEAATQIGQNLTDIITGIDPNRKLFDGVIDAGLIGGVSGGSLGVTHLGASVVGRALAADKEVAQVHDNVKQQEVLIDQIESTDSDPVKSALESRLKTLKFEANQVMDVNYHLAEQMTPEQQSKAAELYSTWNELQAKLDNKEIYTEIAVKAVENTIEGIKEQIQTLKQEVASDVAKKEAKNAVEDKVKEGDAKPKILKPEEIAKSNDISFIGKQEGFEGAEGLDLYNVEIDGQSATFAVPSGSNELTVRAKKKETLNKFNEQPIVNKLEESKPKKTPYIEINAENISELENKHLDLLNKEKATPEKIALDQENIEITKNYVNGKAKGENVYADPSESPETFGRISEIKSEGEGGDGRTLQEIYDGRRGGNRGEPRVTPEEQVTNQTAPNGEKSNLTPANHAFVRTPEFKARFGDWQKGDGSLVLDANGEPLLVYSGQSKLHVEGVEPGKAGLKKIHFTGDKGLAAQYARFRKKQPVVYKGFIKITDAKEINKWHDNQQEFLITDKSQFIPRGIEDAMDIFRPDATQGKQENATEIKDDFYNIETDNAIISGLYGDKILINNEMADLPEKGYLIGQSTLKKGSEKGKGFGQEVYKKALDKFKTIFSELPITDDAIRAQDALVKKGLATVSEIEVNGKRLRVLKDATQSKESIPLGEDKPLDSAGDIETQQTELRDDVIKFENNRGRKEDQIISDDIEKSNTLLEKVKKSTDYYSQRVASLLEKYLVFPIKKLSLGYSHNMGYEYAYLPKPNDNTAITVRYRDYDEKKQWGEPTIYDKTIVDRDGKIIDKRYTKYDIDYKASDEIDKDHLFRGMSGQELENALINGKIESDKNMNFQNQQETTSFAQHERQAFSYAYGFNAWHDNPTFEYPRYVVKVKRSGVDYKLNHVGEADVTGGVPIDNIVGIYEIRMTESSAGKFDIYETRRGDIEEGSRNNIGSKAAIRELSKDEVDVRVGRTPTKDQSTLSGKESVSDNKVEEVPVTEQKSSETAPIVPEQGNEPPKPPESKIQGETTGETGKEQYTLGVRALSSDKIDQDIKDAISKEGIDYIPRGRKVRAEEAQEIVNLFSKEANGLDKISEMIHNSGNGIENDTRTYLNVYLASEYNRLKNEATDAPTREKYRQKTSEAYLYGFDQGRKAGVWVEAQKEWGKVFGSSPEMVQAITRLHIERKNKGFFQSHQQEIEAGKKLFEDVFNSEEGRAKIEAEVSQEIAKIGTSKFGAEGKKKVDDFFSSLLIDPKRQQFYDALLGIPVAAWNGSVLAVKNSILLGMDVASAVQKGVEHLDKWYKENYDKGAVGTPDWNKKDYEAHMTEKLGGLKKEVPVADKTKKPTTQKTKIPPTQEEMVNKLLEKMAVFATKKQLQNFVKDYFQEHYEKGFVSDQRYKDLLSKALGMDYMSPKIEADLTASAQALGNAQKKMQELQDAFEKILATDPTSPEFKELRKGLDNLKKEVDKANFGAQKANQHIKTLLTEEQGLTDKIGSLIQGNLLVPASLLRNIYGNVFFMPARGTRYLVMNTMDSILSGFGKQFEKHLKIDPVAHPDLYRWSQKLPSSTRTVKMGASLRGGAEGFMSGLKEGLRQVKTGQLEDDYQKKEIQRGLEPVKAAVRIWDNLTGKERRNWSKTVGDVLEALPAGYMGEGMFRLLNLGDKPFRRKAEQGRLSEIAAIKGYKGLRREQFMSNPDNASLKDAQNEGDIAVYTNDNIVSKLIQHANTVISKGEQSNKDAIKNTSAIAKVLFKLVKATTLPYVRTPVNLMAESFEYAIPAYSFARAMEATYKGNRREALDYFGKAVVGTVISSVALTLIQNGIITPGSSDDDKVKQAEYSAKEGYRLNLDAFLRKMAGESTDWQDGDNTVTLKGYGTLSMIMMAHADAFKDKTPEEMANQSSADVWATVFPSVITSGLEQSIMTGVNTALQAALKGEKERDRWLINTAGALSSAVYPNTLTNISKTFADENYIRETRDMSKEEGQFKAQMTNTFKDRMFMGKDLPTKVSIWGDKVNLIPEGNTWTWNLLGVSKNKKYQKYSFGTKMFELYEDYKTKDPDEAKNIFPSLPNAKTKVGWDDALMTPMELQDYQIRVGQVRAQYAENYVNSEEFKDASLEDKVSTLTTMYGKARKIAEKEMFDWTAYKERSSDKWQYMYDNDVLPLPSMVRMVGTHKLTKEDKEMLNDMAIGYYGDMVQGIAEQINKLPIEAKVNMLNGRWTSAINMAKAKMNVILSSEGKK